MSEVLPISLTKTQLPDGRWMISYNGDDINHDCGTYYLSVVVDGVKWYSELFTLKNISSAVHPGLIKDTPHCAMRFYDSILKQNYYKCKNLCDLPLNPIDHIIPFVVDVSNLDGVDVNDIKTVIKCYNGQNEYDLSSEFNYTYNAENKVLIHDGHQLSGHLYCGIYYLELTFGGDFSIVFEANFLNWVNKSNPKFPYQPVGFIINSGDQYVSCERYNNQLKLNLTQPGVQSQSIFMYFDNPFTMLPPGDYSITINKTSTGGGNLFLTTNAPYNDSILVEDGETTHNFSFASYVAFRFLYTGFTSGSCIISSLSLKNTAQATGGVKLYSDHFLVTNFTHVPVENLYLYTESGTETGFEQIITDGDGQNIILQL